MSELEALERAARAAIIDQLCDRQKSLEFHLTMLITVLDENLAPNQKEAVGDIMESFLATAKKNGNDILGTMEKLASTPH